MDGSGVEADDLLSVKRQSPGCGQVFNNTLTSPGYPNNYPNDLFCVYWVPIQPGKAMNIYFDEFNVEDTFHCIDYDYLKITNENNQTFGLYCGSQSGSNVTVTGNFAVITFHADGFPGINEKGYRLTFSDISLPPPSMNPIPGNTTYPPCLNTSSPNERVQRSVSDVHGAMKSGSRQKRDVRNAMMIGQLEKKAADLMKKLDTKEAQYKRRALMKKKMAKRVVRKA